MTDSPIDRLLAECEKAESAHKELGISGSPHFAIKLYRKCPGKTAIPFFHGATGPKLRGKVLFDGDGISPSIISIPCKGFRKWVDWTRNRPSIYQMAATTFDPKQTDLETVNTGDQCRLT